MQSFVSPVRDRTTPYLTSVIPVSSRSSSHGACPCFRYCASIMRLYVVLHFKMSAYVVSYIPIRPINSSLRACVHVCVCVSASAKCMRWLPRRAPVGMLAATRARLGHERLDGHPSRRAGALLSTTTEQSAPVRGRWQPRVTVIKPARWAAGQEARGRHEWVGRETSSRRATASHPPPPPPPSGLPRCPFAQR